MKKPLLTYIQFGPFRAWTRQGQVPINCGIKYSYDTAPIFQGVPPKHVGDYTKSAGAEITTHIPLKAKQRGDLSRDPQPFRLYVASENATYEGMSVVQDAFPVEGGITFRLSVLGELKRTFHAT